MLLRRPLASAALAGWTIVLALTIFSVARHPSAILALGPSPFIAEIGLILAYIALAFWVAYSARPNLQQAVFAGTKIGLVVGSILVFAHVAESFSPVGNAGIDTIRGGGSLLLTFGLLGVAGSATWLSTRSPALSIAAGVWCASTAAIMLLSVALSLNLIFEAHMESRLRGAFLASGLLDSGAFLVRNAIESASQILAELSVAAVALSLAGCLVAAFLTTRVRRLVRLLAWLLPIAFLFGVFALWYANSLPRSSRPPFILLGALSLVSVICCTHPIWAVLRRADKVASA